MTVEKAVEKAVSDCIRQGILKEFLVKHKAQVIKMSIYEYDEEKQRKFDREEGQETAKAAIAAKMLERGMPIDVITELCNCSEDFVNEIEKYPYDNNQKKGIVYEYDEEKQRNFDREEGREEGASIVLDELIKDGTITPDRAEEIKRKLKETEES